MLDAERYAFDFAFAHPSVREVVFRDAGSGRLVGLGIVDETPRALSAVYFFWDPELAPSIVEQPEVLGVEQMTVDGAVIRTVVKTTADGQFAVGRELRRRLAEALENSGIVAQIAAARLFPGLPVQPPAPPAAEGTGTGRPT